MRVSSVFPTPRTPAAVPAVAFVVALVAVAFVFVVGVGIVGGSAGCGPACAGDRQGTTGCGCESDQYCATKNAVVFLCKDGACEAGTPEPAPGTHCTKDADCGAGGACGVDSVCVAAPTCERIDEAAAPLFFKSTTAVTGPLTASHDDCTHTWKVAGPPDTLDVDVTIALDGTMTITDNGSSPSCTAGVWSAADRVGAITCGTTTWAIAPSDALANVCFGDTDCSACNSTTTIESVGVCP